MFSSDKNIETIGQLVETLKHYIGLQSEYAKLDVIDKVVRLLTGVAMLVVFFTVLAFLLIYLSFALGYALAPLLGMALAFCAVAAVYLMLFVVFMVNRRKWIERPLVRFFANILFNKQ